VASSVKLHEKRDSVLFPFVDKAMSNERHRSILEAKYSNDLVLLYAGRGDSPRANYYLTASYNGFLDQWAQLPLLAKGPRLRLLQQLQKLTEVGEFLNVHPSTSDAAKAKTLSGAAGALNYRVLGLQIDRLLHQWENRYPARHDTVQVLTYTHAAMQCNDVFLASVSDVICLFIYRYGMMLYAIVISICVNYSCH
jgi:hypothetical protein